MYAKSKIFKVLGFIIVLLIAILIAINILFIKTLCSTRQCLVVNISTITLLLWILTFWLLILRHSEEDKK